MPMVRAYGHRFEAFLSRIRCSRHRVPRLDVAQSLVAISNFAGSCVAVAPHLQPFSFHDSTNTGDLIIVHCAVVKGDAPLSLQWLFNGRHIQIGNEVQITSMGERVSTLTIAAVKGEHAGEYACVADSPAGRVTHRAHLKVNGIISATYTCLPKRSDATFSVLFCRRYSCRIRFLYGFCIRYVR